MTAGEETRAIAGLGGLVEALRAELDEAGTGRRILALAGAPGSGKSHLAEAAVDALNAETPGVAEVLPMDGFHYDDGLLRQMGRLPFKGAPDTFDVGGLAMTLRRLRARDEEAVVVPVFDRALEISRGSARRIGRGAGLIVVEGNYLLLDQAPWNGLAPLFDRTGLIAVSEAELVRRLTARWEGFGMDVAGVRRKLDEVDMPNARRVIGESRAPDWRIDNG